MARRKWRTGDKVRADLENGSSWTWLLTEGDAQDLNDGENPLYPWRARRFELLQAAEEDM